MRHDDGCAAGVSAAPELGEHRFLSHVRTLVAEKHGAAADGDHVVVEYAGVDRVGVLLDKQRAPRRERVSARDAFAGFARLARGKAARRARVDVKCSSPVDEKLDARSFCPG
jgi:hypothetical protein